MAQSSKTKTRKQQVYARLKRGTWVNGPELMTAEIGGSEGLRRVRELRANDGYNIETRKYKGIYQYRLVK